MNLNHPTINLFDSAEKHIFNLMKNDSYPRFLKSTLCQKYQFSQGRKRKTSHSLSNGQYSNDDNEFHQLIKYPKEFKVKNNNDLCAKQSNSENNENILAKKWLNNQFIKVILPNGINEFVSTTQNCTIYSVIENLLNKNSLNVKEFKIFSIKNNLVIYKLNQKKNNLFKIVFHL